MAGSSCASRDVAAEEPTGPLPVVAVVGRPNVGKSTLVNRIIGRRQAVVEDVPGVTRDRVPYDAQWTGRQFTVVDTGGWEPDAKDRAAAIAAQAEIAVQHRRRGALRGRRDGRLHRRGRGRGEDAAPQRQAGDPGRQQGRQHHHRDGGHRRCGRSASVSRTRSPRCTDAAPATCSTPILRGAARGAADRGEPPARPAPGGAGRPPERRQVQPAQPVLRRGARGRRLGRRHHRRPGRQPGRDRRRDLAARRHRRAAQAGRQGQRHRVLRQPAYRRRHRGRRGGRGAARRQRADQRAGPADPLDGRPSPAGRW